MMYSIYQIQREKTRAIGYLDINMFRQLTNQPKAIKMQETYELVYSGEVPATSADTKTLEQLWYRFNMEHPSDYTGRSMSMGDIVSLDDKYYYCDAVGFKEVKVTYVPKTMKGAC